jgi:hypothetical protein
MKCLDVDPLYHHLTTNKEIKVELRLINYIIRLSAAQFKLIKYVMNYEQLICSVEGVGEETT